MTEVKFIDYFKLFKFDINLESNINIFYQEINISKMGSITNKCSSLCCCQPQHQKTEKQVIFHYKQEDIYGTDTRKRLLQTDQIAMNTCIGLITSKSLTKNGIIVEGIGTGILIRPKLVLTCAHNVFDRDRKKVKTQITFYPALNGNRKYGRKVQVDNLRISDKYLQKQKSTSFGYDIALLYLKEEIEIQRQINILIDYTNFDEVHLYGYPRDINIPSHDIFQQYGDHGPIKIQNGRIVHKIPTTGGQSGSPMFISLNKGKDQESNYMIGIHAGASNKTQENYGVLFTKQIFQLLIKWETIMTGNDSIKYLDADRNDDENDSEHLSKMSVGSKIVVDKLDKHRKYPKKHESQNSRDDQFPDMGQVSVYKQAKEKKK